MIKLHYPKSVLAISGRQGSGKSTLANNLVAHMEAVCYRPSIMKFADPLYEMHDACLPVLKRWGIRPIEMTKEGELLQVLGTEYGRKRIHEDVWVDALVNRINHFHGVQTRAIGETRLVIVDDMRFPNEFEAMGGAFRVRLNADRDARRERCSYWREDENHPSESSLDDMEMRFSLVKDTGALHARDVLSSVLSLLGL